MKKSGFDDKKIEEILSSLPEIRDKRSQQEVFRKVSWGRRPERKKIWFGPLLASTAALFLLFLILPFQNDSSEQSAGSGSSHSGEVRQESMPDEEAKSGPRDGSEQPGENKDNSTETAIEEEPEQEQQPASPEEKPKQEEPPAPPELNVSFLAADSEELKNRSVTVAYMDDTVNYTVPMTLISNKEPLETDQFDQLIGSFEEEKLGLSSFMDGVDIRPSQNGESIQVHMDESRTISTSSEALFADIIRESFGGKGYRKAELFTGEEPEIDLGPLGSASSLDLDDTSKKAIYKYSAAGTSAPLFAESNESYETFEEALSNMMKDKNDVMKTVMTEQSAVQAIDKQDKELILTFNGNKLENDENTIFMLEALLLTAKEFDYEEVSFKGIELKKIGTMDVTKPVKVPYGANPVQIQVK